jgi:hypothetical protein
VFRATYKSEDALKDVEKIKIRQDLIIDRLTEKIKTESDEIG